MNLGAVRMQNLAGKQPQLSIAQHSHGRARRNAHLIQYFACRCQRFDKHGFLGGNLGWHPMQIALGQSQEFAERTGLLAALRGDCHTHSDWSDGGSPPREMAEAARALGHEWIALTDHSPRLTVANGLSAERLRDQLELIDALSEADAREEKIEMENDAVDSLVNESQEVSDEGADTDENERG